jgi:hypothetical protein
MPPGCGRGESVPLNSERSPVTMFNLKLLGSRFFAMPRSLACQENPVSRGSARNLRHLFSIPRASSRCFSTENRSTCSVLGETVMKSRVDSTEATSARTKAKRPRASARGPRAPSSRSHATGERCLAGTQTESTFAIVATTRLAFVLNTSRRRGIRNTKSWE